MSYSENVPAEMQPHFLTEYISRINSGDSQIFMKAEDTNYVKAYILVVYFIVVGLLAVYSFSPYSGDVGYILAKLTPHLVYIPLVLTALWYPQQKKAHILIFASIFLILASGFIVRGWSLDIIFTIFTSFIYLWVYFAILLVPAWKAPVETSCSETEVLADKNKTEGKIFKSAEKTELKSLTEQAPPQQYASKSVVKSSSDEASAEFMDVPSEQIIGLIDSLKIRDLDIVSNTTLAIKKIGSPAEPHLINALKSPNLPVRENTAKILGQMRSSDSVYALIDAMNDESKKMHNAAVQALANIGDPAVTPLIESLSDESWRIRAGSCAALRIIGINDAIRIISPLLSDESHYVRKEAAKTLGRIGNKSAADALCRAVNDESRGVRLAAVTALGRIRSEESVIPLFNRFRYEGDCQVRERIVGALGQIGSDSAVTALKYAVKDSDPEISLLAKEYLFCYNQSFK